MKIDHHLDVTETSVDELITTYQTSSKTFVTELQQRQDVLELEWQDLQQAWQKEQDDRRRTFKERKDEATKQQQRETQEYEYALQQARQLDEEEYRHRLQGLYQQLAEARTQQDKVWSEQEAELAEQEKLLRETKARVDAMPQELEAAVHKAKEEGKGIAHHQAKVKADLLAKEIEGEKHLYTMRLQSLEETIQTQHSRIQSLTQQLDAALKQV